MRIIMVPGNPTTSHGKAPAAPLRFAAAMQERRAARRQSGIRGLKPVRAGKYFAGFSSPGDLSVWGPKAGNEGLRPGRRKNPRPARAFCSLTEKKKWKAGVIYKLL